MKVFISQPMTRLSSAAVKADRKSAMEEVKKLVGKDVEFIDSYNPKPGDIFAELGRCLSLMSEADAVYFVPGWSSSFGCSIEYSCARYFNKMIIKKEEI